MQKARMHAALASVSQGLPREQRAELDTLGLRAKAKQYALDTIEAQKEQFKR
jgi:hypothetical protein